MIGNGRLKAKTPDVAASFAELTHDVIELGELQTQLVMLDLKKTSQKTRNCLILCVIGVCILLGTIPVALFALAETLVEGFEWSRMAAFGLATLVGLALSAITLAAGWLIFRKGLLSLQRSREELNRNIAWIKSTLRSRGRVHAAEQPKAS